MKLAACLAAFLSTSAVSVQALDFHAATDPCAKLDKKACLDDSACRYTLPPRNTNRGRKDGNTYGHHSGPDHFGGSCATIHVQDRVNNMSLDQKRRMFTKHGLHYNWSDVECNEAFFLKDCKDINQDAGPSKCKWTCEGGCQTNDLPAGTKGLYSKCSVPGCVDEGNIGDSVYQSSWNNGGMDTSALDENSCCWLEALAAAQDCATAGILVPEFCGNIDKICGSDCFNWDSAALGPQPGTYTLADLCPLMCGRVGSSVDDIC